MQQLLTEPLSFQRKAITLYTLADPYSVKHFWKPVMRWGVWVWPHRVHFSLHVLSLSNLLLGSPSPANKIDTFKTNYCECKHRWSEPNQPKNLFIYPPPPKKKKFNIHQLMRTSYFEDQRDLSVGNLVRGKGKRRGKR